MLVVRKLVALIPTIKIVIMSATMQGELLVRYFENVFLFGEVAAPYFVGTKRYPIQLYFLDQLCVLADTERASWHEEQYKAALQLKGLIRNRSDETLRSAIEARPDVSLIAMDVCTEVVVSQANLGEAILVFLPGMAEIAKYFETFFNELSLRGIKDYFSVFVLHSQVPLDDQREAFQAPPKDKVHVILATNIAESSITLPKLRMVINFGVYRQMEYNSRRHISCLMKKWCSRASCAQRAGRAGRVFEGVAVHLFTRKFYDVLLSEYDPPEMLMAPLAKLVLQAKQIGTKLGVPSPSKFLSLAIEPPSLQQMEAALNDLASLGAIASVADEAVSEEAEITLLGHFSLSLPVDLVLSRLLLLGIFFGCPVEAIVMVASISLSQDVFCLPSRVVMKDEEQFSQSLWKSMQLRFAFDAGACSDPLAALHLFQSWLMWRKAGGVLGSGKEARGQEGGGGDGATSSTDLKSRTKQRRPPKPKSRFVLARTFAQANQNAVRWERLLHFESLVSEISSRVLVHIPEEIILCSQLRKLGALAKHQTTFQWNVTNPRPSAPRRTRPRENADTSFELEFCQDVDVLKALLAAAFSHQMLLGKRRCDSSFKKERDKARRAIDAMRNAGMNPSRGLYMDDLRKVNSFDLQKLASQVFPIESFVHTAVSGCSGYIEFNPPFDQNPKTEKFRAHVGKESRSTSEITHSGANDTMLPLALHLFWQFGERRPFWRVEGISTEFTRPKHPHAVFWNRLSPDGELVSNASWRNITGLISDSESDEGELFLAVASTIQGCENRRTVSAKGLTLLPRLKLGPTAILMVLAFQPLTSKAVRLKVDPADKEIVAIELPSGVIGFCGNLKNSLTGADIVRINGLRVAISQALSASASDGMIPINMIKHIPHLLRNMLSRDNKVSLRGFTHPPTSSHPLPATPQGPEADSVAVPAIEEETGQEDLEGPAKPARSHIVPVYEWEQALRLAHKDREVSNCEPGTEVPPSLDDFQYYPPFHCSLVTPVVERDARVETELLSTPVIFEPRDVRASSLRSVHKDVISKEDGEEEGGLPVSPESSQSESDSSSSGLFKLSPLAKPFVPDGVDSQVSSASAPTDYLLPAPWNLTSLSNALMQFKSVTQQGNREEAGTEKGAPNQMHSFDSISQSMEITAALSGLPPFHHGFGFAMPSSPAHDYFSPEGNLSCLSCHSFALQPHLEGRRVETPNLTGEQLTSYHENLRRRLQQQHHRDAMVLQPAWIPSGVQVANQQQPPTQRIAHPPKRTSQWLGRHSNPPGWHSRQPVLPSSPRSAQQQALILHTAERFRNDSSPHSPSLQREGGQRPRKGLEYLSGIPTAVHIPFPNSPPKSPRQPPILNIQQVPQCSAPPHPSVPFQSPLLPTPPASPMPDAYICPYPSSSLPPSIPFRPSSHPPSAVSNLPEVLPRPLSCNSVRKRLVLNPVRSAHEAAAPHMQQEETSSVPSSKSTLLSASSPRRAGMDVKNTNPLPNSPNFPPVRMPLAPHPYVQAPPYCPPLPWYRPPRPTHAPASRPPPKPRFPLPMNRVRYSPPEWIQNIYAANPNLPPIPQYPEPTVPSSMSRLLSYPLPSTMKTPVSSNDAPSTLPDAHSLPDYHGLESRFRPTVDPPIPPQTKYPHTAKGASKPSRHEVHDSEEDQLVAYFVMYLEKHEGQASVNTLCEMVYTMYKLSYDIPPNAEHPDTQFFRRHSSKFAVFGSSSEGFVVRLKKVGVTIPGENSTAISLTATISNDHESQEKLPQCVSEYPSSELSASARLMHSKPVQEEIANTVHMPNLQECHSSGDKARPLLLLRAPFREDKDSDAPVLCPGDSKIMCEPEQTTQMKSWAPTETLGSFHSRESHESSLLQSPAEDRSAFGLVSADAVEPVRSIGCSLEGLAVEEVKKKAANISVLPSITEESEELKSMGEDEDERGGEEEGEKQEEGKVQAIEEPLTEVDKGLEVVVVEIGARKEEANLEGGRTQEEDREEVAQEEVWEKEEGVWGEEEEMKEGERGEEDEEGQEMKQGEETWEENWDSSSSDTETPSDPTLYEETWDSFSSLTEVDVDESWSTDEKLSSQATGADGQEPWTTPPLEILHDCKATTTHSEEIESPPAESRGECSTGRGEKAQPLEGGHGVTAGATQEGLSHTPSPVLNSPSCSVPTTKSDTREVDREAGMESFTEPPRDDKCGLVSPEAVASCSGEPAETVKEADITLTEEETLRGEQHESQVGKEDSPEKGTSEHMERFFVAHLKRYGGDMPFSHLLDHYWYAYDVLSTNMPDITFFTSRTHLFSVQHDPPRIMLAPGLRGSTPTLGKAESNSIKSSGEDEVELEHRLCALLQGFRGWCSFSSLCVEYRRRYNVTGLHCWLQKEFFVRRPEIFNVRERDGKFLICLCSSKIQKARSGRRSAVPRAHPWSDKEDEMVRFFVKYLRSNPGKSVGFARLCREYRCAHKLSFSNCWVDSEFFSRWPEVFSVTERDGGSYIKMAPSYKDNHRGDDSECKLETEVVRYLTRNGRMCFHSAIQKDVKIEQLCQEFDVRLTPQFFLSRPKIFRICTIDSFEDPGDDCYVFLLSEAAAQDYASSSTSSGDSKPPSPLKERPSSFDKEVRGSKRKKGTKSKRRRREEGRTRPRQDYGVGWMREERERARRLMEGVSGEERKSHSAPAGGRRREEEGSTVEKKPSSAPARCGARCGRRMKEEKERADSGVRPHSSEGMVDTRHVPSSP